MGGFSRAFDLVAAEYGWQDEYIMDLPLRRLRQIVAAIVNRHEIATRMRRSELEWQTRLICAHTAMTIQAKSKDVHKVVDSALELSMYPDEQEPTEHLPPVGSYEALVQGLR